MQVKIARQNSEGHNIMRDGTFLEKTLYTVTDQTSSAEVTVWGEHCINIGQWYSITNISVREFDNKPCLTTTRDTEITPIQSQGTTIFLHSTPNITEDCEIIGAQINSNHICPLKHLIGNMSLTSTKIRCPKCQTTFKSTAIEIKTNGNLTLKSTSGKIFSAKIGNRIIGKVVDVKRCRSDDDIIDALLELPHMTITTHNDFVINIEHINITSLDTDMTAITDHDTTAGTHTETFRDTTHDVENLECDQAFLEIHTPPHTTHPTRAETSPVAIQETPTDTPIKQPSNSAHVQKQTNKKVCSVQLKK